VIQPDLLADEPGAADGRRREELGRGYALYLPRGRRAPADVYHRGGFQKRVDLRDKAARRLLAVELMQHGVNQTRLAEALGLSRQTLHNYRESFREFGVQGLLHGYSPRRSKSEELQRHLHVDKRRPGTKARELEALRRAKRARERAAEQVALAWDDAPDAPLHRLQEPAVEETLGAALATAPATPALRERPFARNHDWQASRYAGVFPILLVLFSQWRWLQRLLPLFGDGWRLFLVFALMAVRNIRSLEQLKHVRHEELGWVLGFRAPASVDTLWGWFHGAAKRGRSHMLLEGFFADQLRGGLVAARFWFTDGHLLPYSGEHKVHYAYQTQRRMPVPGQTNLVTCDGRGRIVCFDIQEGKGDLRARILALGAYARAQSLGVTPVQVFDREGSGVEFFSALVAQHTPFVTWEKHADRPRLATLDADAFGEGFRVNATEYRVLEETKACCHRPEGEDAPTSAEHRFDLRRVVLWNLRTAVLCFDAGLALDAPIIATAMLSRRGASENTFKHLLERHPYHYHPGFGLAESAKQDIANPAIKELERQMQAGKTRLARLYKQQARCQPNIKQDGTPRANSKQQRIAEEIAARETELAQLKADRERLPERVAVGALTDYRSFKAIDNEGKNLFDFVTASVWNARRQLIDWLEEDYAKDSDRVDLLYAILHCHGWVRSDEQMVVVRLEPLQQPARRYAQEHLCRKLTGLAAKIPGGKWLRIEVGDSPV
jgi:ParB-like chromosome segregation protein Spo0J